MVCELVGTDYLYYVGTSFAAPHVSGAAALFVQQFKEDNNRLPSPALVRAAFVNTAVDMPSTGTPHGTGPTPNRHEGWGRLDALALLNPPQPRYCYDQLWPLQTSQTARFEFTVSDTSEPVKFTLAWTDPPGIPDCNPCLVNNLDLDVTTPGGTVHKGNVFDSGWSTTGGTADSLNNLENVYIQNPMTGTYVVEVFAQSVNQDAVAATPQVDQDFSLVVSNGVRRAVSPSLAINNGAAGTNQQTVTLTASALTPEFVHEIRFRNEGTLSTTTDTFGLDAIPYDGWQDYAFVLEPFDLPGRYLVDPGPDPYFKTVESLHPYPNEVNLYSWTVNGNAGTVRMEVGFVRVGLTGSDSIAVYDDQGQSVFTTSASGVNIWTGPIMTNSVTIKLKTLGGGSAWGFLAEVYIYDTSSGTPYPADYNECWFIDYNPLFVNGNHRVRLYIDYFDTFDSDDRLYFYDSRGLISYLDVPVYGMWTSDLWGDFFGDVKICFTSDGDDFRGDGFRIQHVRAFVGYARGMDRWWQVRKAGASSIQAHFAVEDVSSGDSLILLSDSGTSLTIDPVTGWSSEASGDRIRANLVSNTDYETGSGASDETGFIIDQILFRDYAWSAWESFTTAQSKQWTIPSGDGTKTVYAQLRDKAGKIHTVSDSIILDAVTPSFTDFNINNGASETASRSVTLYITASDPAPSAGLLMRFRNNDALGTGSWTSWETYASTRAWNLFFHYGERCVDAEVKDGADNYAGMRSDCIYYVREEPGGGGTPYAAPWNGIDYVNENNILPLSEDFGRTALEVEDRYLFESALVPVDGHYSVQIREFERERSYLDTFELMTVDHASNTHIAFSPDGDLLTYRAPRGPIGATDQDGRNVKALLLNPGDDRDFEGYRGDSVVLRFKPYDGGAAKLILRTDIKPPGPASLEIATRVSGDWQSVATLIPRAQWAFNAVDLAPFLVEGSATEVRISWTDHHKLDYVGLDTSDEERVTVNTYGLSFASHSVLGDVTDLLLNDDDVYAELQPGEHLVLGFPYEGPSRGVRDIVLVLGATT